MSAAPTIERSGAAAAALAELERKPPESLSSSELVRLALGRVEREREAAQALRRKLEEQPALGNDKATQRELFRFVSNPVTTPDALAAMAALPAPLAADLLYEVWTTPGNRPDATELARALLYSADVRGKASTALAVTLDLRAAQTCEQYRSILPNALRDGDRRAVSPLAKLVNRRGCGPKKNQDCYACLRDQADELKATLNAAKSRRPPSYVAP